jgi:LPXTG-motif cell wall-anchored protein
MRKHTALLLAAMAGVVGVMGAGSQPVSAQNAGVCEPLDSGKIDTEDPDAATVTVEAPDGKLIDGYCVKAGAEQSGGGPIFIPVTPPAKKVVVDYPNFDSVSHYSLSYLTIVTPTVVPTLNGPTCDAPGTVTIPVQEHLTYEETTDEDGNVTVIVKADDGYVIPAGVVTSWKFSAAALARVDCVETPPTPPADPPVVIVDAGGPLPPTQAPAPAPAPPAAGPAAAEAAPPVAAAPAPTALPATGSTSWALALSALAMLAGGLGLRRLSRRTDDSII